MKKLDLNILNKYCEDGLLMKVTHPNYPLILWKYTRKVQYENKWDNITTQMRSVITDTKGNIIARPFPKFFNYNQLPSVGLSVPNEEFDVFEKVDGSLIITFWYDNKWMCASTGSFTSDYVVKANELLQNYPTFQLLPNLTYCFELLWTEHIIVIKPEKDDLILIGALNTDTGEDVDIHNDYYSNFNVVKKYNGITDITKLTEIFDGTNREGFVVKFKSGFRCKIKYNEYLRLHKIMTNCSNIDIWEALKNGEDMNIFITNVPDEFDSWVRFNIEKLNEMYKVEWFKYVKIYNKIYNKFNGDLSNMKLIAEEILTNYSKYKKPLFNMFNEKEVDEYIWNLIRPTFEAKKY